MSTEVMETTQKQRALRNRDQDRLHYNEERWLSRALECVSPSPAVSPPHPHPVGPTCVSLRVRCLSVPSVGIHAGDLRGKRPSRQAEEGLWGQFMAVTFYFRDHRLDGHRDLLNGRGTFLNLHLSIKTGTGQARPRGQHGHPHTWSDSLML